MSFERPELLALLLLAVPIVGFALASRRRLGPARAVVATAVRLLLLLVLVLAAAGVTRNKPVDALAVVFAIDQSASIDANGKAEALEFVRQALEHREGDDVAGIVAFGGDALVELAPTDTPTFTDLESSPSPHQTDISAGLRLASALLPADRARRIVVLTDGEETRGDAGAQALLTAGDDLQILVVPLDHAHGPDVVLDDLLAPARVDEGGTYEIRVVARSSTPTTGKLRLYRNDDYLGDVAVTLSGARSEVFSFRQEATEAGLFRYRAVFEPDDAAVDTVPQNDVVMSTVQVTGRSRILVVDQDPSEVARLAAALGGEGFEVDVIRPEDLPAGLSGLRPYSSVFFSNVPAYAMSTRQHEAIQAYVRDLGRGFVMIGGDESFGVGGYYRTAIEEALPVRMDLEDKTRFPKLAMVHAIDKSCSMSGQPLDMAKEAAIRTVELLSDRDMFGAIGFDDSAAWIFPLTEMTARDEATATIASLRIGGGTDIYPALDRAYRGMAQTDAALKHVVVLSDGITAPGDFQGLITAATAAGVTTTAIAIGQGADRVTMERFANWGGGSYYLVTDPSAIPAIFTRETMLASRSFLVEEPTRVAQNAPSDLLRGLTAGDFPTFAGYVATEPKERAVVPLVTVEEEGPSSPILAHWYYGLGRSVAFTSDATSRWSGGWVQTPEYTQFWAQVGRWVVGTGDDQSLDVTAEIVDGELVVTVDAYDPTGAFRNFLVGEARVVAPDLTVRPVELRQVGPGRYQAVTPVDQDGSWLAGVALKAGDQVVGQTVTEAVQPYSPEYRSRGAGRALAQELGRLGGGGVIDDPALVFARPPVPREVPVPWWPTLLWLLPFLLLLDVAARRLAVGGRGPKVAEEVLRRGAEGARRFRTPPKPKAPSATDKAKVDVEPEEPQGPMAEPEVVDPESYAGRLLAARKNARKRMDQE
jgi:Mg-chelatase subunit ChlD